MAQAEAAKPSVARHLSFSGIRFPRRATISGHARLIAAPAYQRLLAAEPLLRKLIPILIVIFLLIVGAARFVELYQLCFGIACFGVAGLGIAGLGIACFGVAGLGILGER